MTTTDAQLFVLVAYLTSLGAICVTLGRLSAFHYDTAKLTCEYQQRKGGYSVLMAKLFTAAIAIGTVGCLVWRWVDLIAVFIPTVITIVAFFSWLDVHEPRQYDLDQRLSALYMQHKWGLDQAMLLGLLQRHDLPYFPIVYYETRLKLTTQQCLAYSASEPLRHRMAELVLREFCTELSAEKPRRRTLEKYRHEAQQAMQIGYSQRIHNDFYKNADKQSQ